MTEQEFRKDLHRITEQYTDKNTDEQIRAISELAKIYPHSIELIERANLKKGVNCFMYALNMSDFQDTIVENVMETAWFFENNKNYPYCEWAKAFPGSDWIGFCIDSKFLVEITDVNNVQDNDIIVYFNSPFSSSNTNLQSKFKLHCLLLLNFLAFFLDVNLNSKCELV